MRAGMIRADDGLFGHYNNFLLTWVCKDTNCLLWMLKTFQVLKKIKINTLLFL